MARRPKITDVFTPRRLEVNPAIYVQRIHHEKALKNVQLKVHASIKRGVGIRSRMSGEVHVRICEGLGVRFPWATRPFTFFSKVFADKINNLSLSHAFCTISKHCLLIDKIDNGEIRGT